MAKASNLRDQSIEELEATYSDRCKELYQLVNDHQQSRKLEKPHLIRQTKREIARLLTIIKEKQSSNA